jgi:hypothetical protein
MTFAVLIAGCGTTRNERKEKAGIMNNNNKNNTNMEHLNKSTFITKVFNYEQNKEWKYEGEGSSMPDRFLCRLVRTM